MDMAVFLLSLFLQIQVGLVLGSNYGFDQREKTVKGKLPIYNRHINNQWHSQHTSFWIKSATDRPILAQKIEEDLPRVATAFLHTGDPFKLKRANCSRRYELGSLRDVAHISSQPSLHSALDTVVHATNFLNMILQTNRSRERNLRGDIEWYHALVRSILEGDPKIQRAVVTFNAEPWSSGSHVFLQATRADSEIVLQDLSSTAHHLKNKTAETEWFNELKFREKPHLHKRVLSHDIRALDATLRRGGCYVIDKTQIKWSAPYLECDNGNFVPHWLLTLSAGFYGLRANLTPEFRGVVRVDINLQNVDIDQCTNEGWFAGTHRCNLTSTECIPIKGLGFVLDAYKCVCRLGFYHPKRLSANGYKRKQKTNHILENSYGEEMSSGVYECLPCKEGCTSCTDDTPCYVQEDGYLRTAVVSFQALCMFLDFISMILAYHFRRKKSIRASGLILLETILFGALLLYFPVVILYFQPSVFRCILLRWVRLLGFATVYGTVTLKLYRVLKVFLSRTAQRIPYMTSWRVLRMLGVILLIVCWFLIAWTSAVFQNMDKNVSIIVAGVTPDNLQFNMCLIDRWDYMMAVAEFLFLLWGVYLCYAVRTVPSAFHEPRYMAVAVHNELIISAISHTIRFTLVSSLHPDWMLMLLFAHTHLTVTVTLGLLLIPKFLLEGAHPRDDVAAEAYEDELDLGRSGSYLNSSITSAWSEHSLDPDDIREELKKLYTQLEIYKRKKMIANNPHLQKKRSSKKGLGRSIMKRITEIPETVSRQCNKEEKEFADHNGARNSISTLRKNPFDPSHCGSRTKEESLKHKVFSLKKSHSSYDHVRDQTEDSSNSTPDKMEVSTTENSLLDALMSKKLTKKSVDTVEAESTESVPLVCKSASAHNLTADKKPLHPRTSMLQKSLSVIASAKEKTLGLTGKAHSLEESHKQPKCQSKSKDSIKAQLEKIEKIDAYQENVAKSPEGSKKPNKLGIIKHQAITPVSSDSGKSGIRDQCDVSDVCPWEIQDVPPEFVEAKVQRHVSIAPTDSSSLHVPHTKAKLHQRQKSVENPLVPGRPSKSQTPDKAEVCPWEHEEAHFMSGDSNSQSHLKDLNLGTFHKADASSRDLEENFPGMRLKSTELDRNIAEDPKKNTHLISVQNKDVLPQNTKCDRNSEALISKADVCPWDFDDTQLTNAAKVSAPSPFVKSKESLPRKKGASTFTKAFLAAGLERDKEKSRDRDEDKRKKGKERGISSKSVEKASGHSKMEEVCPWEADTSMDASILGKRRNSPNELSAGKGNNAEICPWDFESIPDASKQDQNSSTTKHHPNSKKGKTDKARLAEVCPWDYDDQIAGKTA
ncbi:probable G-protein coupled receptor 158 [Polypterus senegalus]|uniref:probable G-protein coupled receptor 158 n=1 Tax=Polypterus senegalus TaxID=55291 RepID=UPI001965EFE4|nr:probable G-protein coupled receptor 158 [Polypterus senegalus]